MITLQGVSFDYEKEDRSFRALDGIDLKIHPASHVAVLGHNGCGKSTLAKHLNALLLPTEGSVKVDDMDTANSEYILEIRKRVGMVFQNPDNQLVATTVREDVAFGPENLGLAREEILKRIEESLKQVDMWHFRDAEPHHLSGGQKQRVAIAGVIAMKPAYLVFDEPTAMLDPQGRQEVIHTMLKLNQQEKISIINITHFMEEAVLADRILVMDEGKIVLDGKPKEVFRQVDTLRSLQLDVPVVTEIAGRLHEQYPHIPKDVLSIDEMVEVLCL